MSPVASSNQRFNEVISRSKSDLYMLATPTEHGMFPYAGIPWYSTVFGRDGIITAMMLLSTGTPSMAKGVLRHLADMQATKTEPQVMLSRARSFMSAVTARWRDSVKCRSGGITAPSTQHPFF